MDGAGEALPCCSWGGEIPRLLTPPYYGATLLHKAPTRQMGDAADAAGGGFLSAGRIQTWRRHAAKN